MSKMSYDLSTLNIDRLKKLKVYELPGSYRLQDTCGNGCAGDAPGYPTYFTRSVFTGYGNTPPYREGRVTQVITFEGKNYVVAYYGQTDEQHDALLRRLFKPLPEEHPRVQAWIRSRYTHFNHCYLHPTEKEYETRRKTVIFPVPSYELKTFVDDKRFSEEWRQKAQAEVAAHNAEITNLAAPIATPDNHAAVVYIREFYPDHVARLDLIENPSQEERDGDWWERYAERPTRDTCPGPNFGRMNAFLNGHRTDGWCQLCGYTTTPEPAAVQKGEPWLGVRLKCRQSP